MEASLRRTRNSEIFDLLAVSGGVQRRFKILAMGLIDPIHEAVADQFILAITGFKAAAIGIADETGGIEDKDHALGGVQDLLVEVSLAL